VARRLREERVLLLLDGVEPLQDAEGTLRDMALKALLLELDTENASTWPITTSPRAISPKPNASSTKPATTAATRNSPPSAPNWPVDPDHQHFYQIASLVSHHLPLSDFRLNSIPVRL
jgi:hypothetical protein